MADDSIKIMNSIPPNVTMVYGKVLKKDNPLVASWVSSVQGTLGETDTPENTNERVLIMNMITQFFEKMLCMLFKSKAQDQ